VSRVRESRRPDRELTEQRFAVLRDPARSPQERRVARDALVTDHLPLVAHCARAFRHRGEPWDDLVQAGSLGLLLAVDRFDPGRGVAFSTFAVPTILGELKRHFRDRAWALHVPRRTQALALELTVATTELTQTLGRSPTVPELAARVHCEVDQVLEALAAARGFATVSLDVTDPVSGEAAPPAGLVDGELGQVELRAVLTQVLDGLDPRTQRIVALRLFGQRTQAQIATEVGLSQVHVSRILERTLRRIRAELTD
jgi:RNA polymerase sigma-B factor